MMEVEYRVQFESGAYEWIRVTGRTFSACIAAAIRAARRYDRDTGKRDHVLCVEFWQRLD